MLHLDSCRAVISSVNNSQQYFHDLQLTTKSLQITLKNRYKLIELFSLYALECTGLYKACHKSGLPWLHCKSIINWMDGSSNSISHTLGAEVSASYVEHVLNTFYIPEEIEGRLLNIFIVSIYQSDFH